jgi:8-oxo-dGTP pyrophosphatase MutT (NUDIX family)
VHATGMFADTRRLRQSDSKKARLRLREHQAPSECVRLVNLRKLTRGEQVAAVCYRIRSDIEFLLVRTRGGGRWTFPKGSAEPGLTPAQAAALEAFEEAGVHGRIEQASFAHYIFRKCGKSERRSARDFIVHAHLCQVVRLARPKEPDRDRTWFSAEEAKRRLRKGRETSGAAALTGVIEKAILRIENLRIEGSQDESARNQKRNPAVRPSLSRQSLEKDALQIVQFEARTQPHRWQAQVPLLPKGVRKLDAMPSYSSLNENQPRKLLQ